MLINVDFIYPVGCLFITTDTTFNPNITFGGTWARLEGDVYLKNIPSTSSQPIGNYGGTSTEHKIPIESMPNHEHLVRNNYGYIDTTSNSGTGSWGQKFNPSSSGGTAVSSNHYRAIGAGGGQAYYPYYYGIICWHRTA